jgi:hypothetical protein
MGRYTWQLLWLHGATAPVILGERRLNINEIEGLQGVMLLMPRNLRRKSLSG